MDTVTQALLGGAVGFAVAGKISPRKAVLWGAAIAILPDLDVFIPYDNDLTAITHHRSWSHSWLIQTLLAPLFAWLLYRFDKTVQFKHWWLLVWFALITHSGLDALTVYGTQLFWPFMPSPYSGGSVFIIDPVYTLPLLVGFIAIVFRPNTITSQRLIKTGFTLSCVYLVWGLLAQNWVSYNAKRDLAAQHIKTEKILVTATPFNTLLWRILVVDNDVYYEGFRSVFDGSGLDGSGPIKFTQYKRNSSELINALQHSDALKRLSWFTNGFYSVKQVENSIIATDLRMGLEPIYFFRYHIAQTENHAINVISPMRIDSERRTKQGVTWTWQRIWDPTAQFNSVSNDTNS
ncbi:MAG: metal-dependent hydrolase [Gammaproteobacteria bacterium]|nr:metal-dependent hydrolase [Gammaproteobacteria bacterium]